LSPCEPFHSSLLNIAFNVTNSIRFAQICEPFTPHLFKDNRGCALVGTRTSNDNHENNNTTTTTSIVCIPCLPTTIFVSFCDLVHVILAVGIVHNSCLNPNILKILVMLVVNHPCKATDTKCKPNIICHSFVIFFIDLQCHKK
jgi:hypothetical protein